MAFVGGFLGGGVEMVPAGQMQVLLQWNTEDRQNISGTVFTLTKSDGTSGPYTVNGDASGRAEIIVPAGEYTVEVSHSGSYENDGPQKVIGESTQSYLVLFDAYFNRGATLFFKYTIANGTYTLVKDESGQEFTGSVIAGASVLVSPGSYHVEIVSGTHSWESDIIITGDTVLSDYAAVPEWESPALQSLVVDDVTIPLTNGILVSSDEYHVVATLEGSWTSGIPVTCTYDLLVDKPGPMDIRPEYSDVFCTYSVTSITVPFTGVYDVMAVGGGGGGGASKTFSSNLHAGRSSGGGGGGSGYYNIRNDESLTQGATISITIGAGGAAGTSGSGGAGKSTSISLPSRTVAASGGNGGETSNFLTSAGGPGGDGGAGGGGGRGYDGYNSSNDYVSASGGEGGGGSATSGAVPSSNNVNGGGGGGGGNFTFAGISFNDTSEGGVTRGGSYGGGNGASGASAAAGGRILHTTIGVACTVVGDTVGAAGGNGGASTTSTSTRNPGSAGNIGRALFALKVRA